MISVVLGGSGSGKSALAEDLIINRSATVDSIYYIATMRPYGEEGLERVKKHRSQRAGKGFTTIECHKNLANAIGGDCLCGANIAALVECISNLVANEMYDEDRLIRRCDKEPEDDYENRLCSKIVDDLEELIGLCQNIVIVTNNVFEDGKSYDSSTRSYMRVLARVNAMLAKMADEVIEVVVGIPIKLK